MVRRLGVAGTFVVLGVVVTALVSWSSAADGPAAPPAGVDAVPAKAPVLAVTIAEPINHRQRSLRIGGAEGRFHVVVSNISKEPQKVWREWCSWGYFNLTFKMTDGAGKETTLKKKSREWLKNYPDYWVLDPGDMFVIEVRPADWEGFPAPVPGKGQKVRLQAIYETAPDDHATKENVWTGQVMSQAREYILN